MRKNKGKWLFAATFFNILCIIGLNQYEKTGINRKKVSTQHSRLHPAASGVKQKLACQATGNLECAERIVCGFVTAQVLSSYERKREGVQGKGEFFNGNYECRAPEKYVIYAKSEFFNGKHEQMDGNYELSMLK